MDYQIKPLSFSEVRAIAARVIREEPTPNDLIQAARESLLVRCQDAVPRPTGSGSGSAR